MTHAAAGSNFDAFDIDGGKTSILSAPVTVPTSSPRVQFSYYFAHLANATADDYFRVSVRSGGTTKMIMLDRGSASVSPAMWKEVGLPLDEYAGQSIRILVEAADAGSPSVVEAGFDDLEISRWNSGEEDGDRLTTKYDLDSDNDGLWDSVEAGANDSDNDGLVDDPADRGSITNPIDTDGDGIPNHLDLESNNAANDGTDFDIARSGFSANDTNGDGRVNNLDVNGGTDADRDGIDDVIDSDPTTPGSPGDGVGITISISDGTVDEGAGVATLDLTLSAASGSAVTVSAFSRTSDSNATPGRDFYGISEEVTFAAGETGKKITIPIINDSDVEDDETIVIRLAAASGARIADDFGVLTIIDDDDSSTLPAISVAGRTVAENVGVAGITVTLTPAATSPVTVIVFTRPTGQAIPGQDYYGMSQSLEFAVGETSKALDVMILDDAVSEATETFSVLLTNASGARIEQRSAEITITDDDAGSGSSVLSIANQTVLENTRIAEISVTLSPASATQVSVTTFTRDIGSAETGQDFFGNSSQLVFAAGETTKTFSVVILDDAEVETEEAFEVRLAEPVGATIDGDTATITISDNDGGLADRPR